MKHNEISHEGTVVSIGDGHMQVSITRQSACEACKVATHCIAAEGKPMTVDIANADVANYTVGERVRIVETKQVAVRALVMAFVIPLVIMVATLAIVTALTGNEGLGALASLAVLVVCFLCMRMISGRIEHQLQFRVTKLI